MNTEFLWNFVEDLRHITRELNEPSEILRKVTEKLRQLPYEPIEWIRFEKEFQNDHPEFVGTLKERFPLLTKQELRLCQLLHTGLKSHEAARLLCVTERAIEFHRLNLRKKFQLKKGEDLQKFLAGL